MAILRTYTRLVVPSLDDSLPLFETLTNSQALRFPYGDMQVAIVGSFLLVSIPDDAKPEWLIQAVCAVDDVNDTLQKVTDHDAECLSGPKDVPTGRNFVARHADGLVIEYVQLRPDLATLLLSSS